ncbi:MAG TPA: response regulator [Phycisphaerales bacterium]|nr:response regulator [Phycisphaerales bacterium]
MRVLVVDDSKTMRSIQRAVLENLGHTEVLEATDGQDAVNKARAFRPDLILVDWNMPVMDGLSFVKAWRATNKNTPIIMVTRESEKRRVVEAIAAGVNGYVVKPFTPDFLSQRIEETLARCGVGASRG